MNGMHKEREKTRASVSGTKRILLAAMFLVMTISLVGCGEDTDTKEVTETIIFKDDVGREVELPEEIDRVVTLGSTGQIMMISLAPDMLLGINTPIERSPEEYIAFDISSLPVVGQYYGQRTLNLEEVASLGGDVIIDLGDTKKNSAADMDEIQQQTGIPTIHISATLETAPDAFRKLGELLGKEDRAEELAVYCEDIYERIETMLDAVGEENELRIISCAGQDGLTVTVKGSAHSEILDFVAVNAADTVGNNGTVSIEQMHIWDPDVILFTDTSIYDDVADMPEWASLTAIQEGRYYEIPNGPYDWIGSPPTVNRYLGLVWLVETLYPQQSDYDLKEEVKEYYRLFYNCDLTEQQYELLTENAVK